MCEEKTKTGHAARGGPRGGFTVSEAALKVRTIGRKTKVRSELPTRKRTTERGGEGSRLTGSLCLQSDDRQGNDGEESIVGKKKRKKTAYPIEENKAETSQRRKQQKR